MLKNGVGRTDEDSAASRSARASDVPASGMRAIDRGAVRTAPPPPYAPRDRLDSVDETSVKLPSPVLLAIARGDHRRPPRRTTWFAIGVACGAALAWLATGDVRARVVTARAWAADAVTVVHHAVAPDAP